MQSGLKMRYSRRSGGGFSLLFRMVTKESNLDSIEGRIGHVDGQAGVSRQISTAEVSTYTHEMAESYPINY